MADLHDLDFDFSALQGWFADDNLVTMARAVGRPLAWVRWYEDRLAVLILAEFEDCGALT